MGAWGIGPFENDEASDWLYDLSESSDTSVISTAFDVINEKNSDYLDAMDCSNALAAAEIIAALLGRPRSDLPENAKEWVTANSTLNASSLVPNAVAAISHIRNDSELKELWEETDDAADWYSTIDDLLSRLKV